MTSNASSGLRGTLGTGLDAHVGRQPDFYSAPACSNPSCRPKQPNEAKAIPDERLIRD